jgi:hypothetical protein
MRLDADLLLSPLATLTNERVLCLHHLLFDNGIIGMALNKRLPCRAGLVRICGETKAGR